MDLDALIDYLQGHATARHVHLDQLDEAAPAARLRPLARPDVRQLTKKTRQLHLSERRRIGAAESALLLEPLLVDPLYRKSVSFHEISPTRGPLYPHFHPTSTNTHSVYPYHHNEPYRENDYAAFAVPGNMPFLTPLTIGANSDIAFPFIWGTWPILTLFFFGVSKY